MRGSVQPLMYNSHLSLNSRCKPPSSCYVPVFESSNKGVKITIPISILSFGQNGVVRMESHVRRWVTVTTQVSVGVTRGEFSPLPACPSLSYHSGPRMPQYRTLSAGTPAHVLRPLSPGWTLLRQASAKMSSRPLVLITEAALHF